MRREPPPRANPVRALVAGVALLVAFQWYGPGGYAHIKFQREKPQRIQAAPEENGIPFGPHEMYGPFRKSEGKKSAG